MKDQYGADVSDLIRLNVSIEDIEADCSCLFNMIISAEWYEYNKEIYIPVVIASVLEQAFGVRFNYDDILYSEENEDVSPLWIPSNLKRFDYDGLGFYHA